MRTMLIRNNPILPTDIEVGWRVTFPSGNPFERFIYSCRDESALHNLIEDCRKEYGDFAIEDRREAEKAGHSQQGGVGV
jgi:hypothetical protein